MPNSGLQSYNSQKDTLKKLSAWSDNTKGCITPWLIMILCVLICYEWIIFLCIIIIVQS